MAAFLLVLSCAPAFAAVDPPPTDSRGDFYDWVINSGSLDEDRPGGPFGPGHGGGRFSKERYDEWVSDLPATGVTSSGNLIWQVCAANVRNVFISTAGRTDLDPSSVDPSATTLSHLYDFGSGFCINGWYGHCDVINLPVSGSYRLTHCPCYNIGFVKSDGTVSKLTWSASEGTFKHYDATKSSEYIYCTYPDIAGAPYAVTASFTLILPIYEIIPDSAIDFNSNTQYNVNTRPTTITGGNYGIVGDDNQITTVNDNRKIVNEGDNIYYNPATGQTQNITDWSYDYSSRIYNITLDTGDKVSVEYGDENISIVENKVVEGDTIVNNYTIYYMIDGSGSGESHTHEWYKTGERQATCLVPAQRTYTCSVCGEQKTETDPVLGHSWHAIKTVTTQYDESGNLTQEGYTIYECERCGEQYKSTNDTGPPSTGGDSPGTGDDKESIWEKIGNFLGTILEGIIGIFDAILGKLLDALVALSEMLLGKIKDVVAVVLSVLEEVPALFSGFLNFLGLVFPFLPPEITLLLTFGVIAVVFIGIIKAIRR